VYRRIEAERKAAADENRVVNHDHVEAELEKQIRDLQSDLLEIEMKLQDALFISRKSFISKISSIIEEMRTLNSSYI
jgi:phage host-nuclease inhibitor protein Gam